MAEERPAAAGPCWRGSRAAVPPCRAYLRENEPADRAGGRP